MAEIFITDKSPMIFKILNGKPACVPEYLSDDGKGEIESITINDSDLIIWKRQWKKLMVVNGKISYVYFVGKKKFKELTEKEKLKSNSNDDDFTV